MNRTFVLSLLLVGCGSSPSGPWLEDPRVLVSGHDITNKDCRSDICRHNENTDLVNWHGAIWLVHRTAISQVLGPNSSLHVYQSVDSGLTFGRRAILTAPLAGELPDTPMGRDLRDPSFYIVGDTLYIKALTRLPVTSERDSFVDTIAVETHSTDGENWSPFTPIGPTGWSYWRIREHAGTYYSAAYQDGDKSIMLYSSTDGVNWTAGPTIYGVSADTPVETELVFLPSGQMLALVRMDGLDQELLGSQGRLRTKVCRAMPPYSSFDCPQEITGQRLDGPLAFFHGDTLWVVARKHLGADGRKRTSLFRVTGDLESGPIDVAEVGELPSAGDTSYAGEATIDENRTLVTWYSGDLTVDETWIFGILDLTDIRIATIDFSHL
jgi:hypothetical protein